MSQCKVALVTSAGLHLRDDQPFTRDTPGGESTYRVIPSDCDPSDVVQSHFSIGFDHTGIYRDLNVTFPVDRLRELKDRGDIGSLSDNYYSFMGALRDASTVINETGPEVARRMKAEGVGRCAADPHLTSLHPHRECACQGLRGTWHRHRHHCNGARTRCNS